MKTAAIIPAWNEARRVRSVVEETRAFVDEVIVVDDGSDDGTCRVLTGMKGVVALRHRMNLGKGAALKTGCDYAVQHGAEYLVVMDSDGQHLPKEVPLFLAALTQHGAEIAFGARRLAKEQRMPLVVRFGNTFLSLATRVLFGISVSDTQSGFRAFTRRAYEYIRWDSTDYSVETEMVIRAGKKHLPSREIPITTIYHDRYKGTTVFTGIRIFLSMLLWRIRP